MRWYYTLNGSMHVQEVNTKLLIGSMTSFCLFKSCKSELAESGAWRIQEPLLYFIFFVLAWKKMLLLPKIQL